MNKIAILLIICLCSCATARIRHRDLSEYKWIWQNEEERRYEEINTIVYISNELIFSSEKVYLIVEQGCKNLSGEILHKESSLYVLFYEVHGRELIIYAEEKIIMKMDREGNLSIGKKVFTREEKINITST